MITVPACIPCNQVKKELDSFLRDFLALDARTDGHPIAEELLIGPFSRAVIRRQSSLSRIVAKDSKWVAQFTDSNLFSGFASTADIGSEVEDEVGFIVRGLSFHHEGTRLPTGADIVVSHIERHEAEDVWNRMQKTGSVNGPFSLGTDICHWAFIIATSGVAAWLISFYSSVFYFARVTPNGDT